MGHGWSSGIQASNRSQRTSWLYTLQFNGWGVGVGEKNTDVSTEVEICGALVAMEVTVADEMLGVSDTAAVVIKMVELFTRRETSDSV